MATTWKAPTWRMPNDKNQSKFENYGLTFNGSSEYISASNVSNIATNTQGSISFWINFAGGLNTRYCFGISDADANTFLNIGINNAENLDIILREAGVNLWRLQTTGNPIVLNTWQHICLTQDGNSCEVYVDGVQPAQSGAGTEWLNSLSGLDLLTIGALFKSSVLVNPIEGKISQLSVFDYALSESQVSSLYNAGSPINPMTLKPAPVAYYPLGGNASTGGDSTNTLSVPNIAVPDASVFEFDGNNDVININNDSAFNLGTSFTISGWFNFNYTNSLRGLISFDSVSTRGWFLYSQTGNKIKLYDGYASPPSGDFTLTSSYTNSGSWDNFIITYDGTNLVFYINGVQESTQTVSVNLQTNGNDGQIGNNQFSSNRYFNGEISNVQFWDTDLSSTEINTLYNNGIPLLTGTQPQEANLKAWYKLDQSANWEADTAGEWQIPDAVSSYPQSFDFDGSNDFINTNLNVDNYTNLTYSVWVNPTSLNQKGGISDLSSSDNFGAYFWSGSGGQFYVNIGSTFSNIAGTWSLNKFGTLGEEKWLHIAIVYDGSGATDADRLKVYADGDYVAFNSVGSIPTSIPSGGGDLIIGKSNTYEFEGKMSNVMLFDSSLPATGADSIETLYNNGTPLTTSVASDSLKAWYKLNDNEKFDGTNWSVENQKYPANWDSALDFNGTSSSVNIPAFSDYDNGDLSACIWVNTSDTRTNTDYVFSNSGSSTKAGFDIAINRYGSVKTMRKTRTLTADTGFNVVGLTENTWHHIAFTYEESTNTIKQYFDGQLTETVIGSSRTKAASLQLTIGSYQDTGSFFLGKLSNAAIYNTVLDPATITAIYNNGTPETSISGSPVAWWKLDNLTTGIQDSVGSKNGTNNGATKVNTFVSTEAGESSGMTEQNLVNNNVSALNGESSGMDTSNLVTSTLTRQVPYNSYSLSFDAVNDYIDCGNILDQSGTDAFSISSWFYLNSTKSNTIVGKMNSSFVGYQLYVNAANKLKFLLQGTGNLSATGNTVLSLNNWYNVVLTYDGSGTTGGINLYLNGATETFTGSGSNSGGVSNSEDFEIGARTGAVDVMDGKLSNISIFNEELTSTEVQKLYNSGVPGDLSSFNPSPIAWWSLGSDSYFNGSSWICPDLIGTNNGTSSGMDANALIGDAPNSTANGTSTNMAIDANLTGNAPNSSNNSFSVNMSYDDREIDVPS